MIRTSCLQFCTSFLSISHLYVTSVTVFISTVSISTILLLEGVDHVVDEGTGAKGLFELHDASLFVWVCR